MSNTLPMQEATILQYAKQLYLPTLGEQSTRLAEEAVKKKQSHLSYLEALLEAEIEERNPSMWRTETKQTPCHQRPTVIGEPGPMHCHQN